MIEEGINRRKVGCGNCMFLQVDVKSLASFKPKCVGEGKEERTGWEKCIPRVFG